MSAGLLHCPYGYRSMVPRTVHSVLVETQKIMFVAPDPTPSPPHPLQTHTTAPRAHLSPHQATKRPPPVELLMSLA